MVSPVGQKLVTLFLTFCFSIGVFKYAWVFIENELGFSSADVQGGSFVQLTLKREPITMIETIYPVPTLLEQREGSPDCTEMKIDT